MMFIGNGLYGTEGHGKYELQYAFVKMHSLRFFV